MKNDLCALFTLLIEEVGFDSVDQWLQWMTMCDLPIDWE